MKLLATICLALATIWLPSAQAMTLNPHGTGQYLLFPYFTVNRHQQTLIGVSNATDAAKALRVRFREAYDGREVLDFNVFLPARATWTSVLFSLDDAGLSGGGAAIRLDDAFCTVPAFYSANTLPDGALYQPFLDYGYVGPNDDTGPTDDTRMREGYFEIVEMAEVTGATRDAITPVNGRPPGCAAIAAGDVAESDLQPPTGGLAGSEAIVDASLGTFYTAAATALDGVYNRAVYTPSGTVSPDLRDASVGANGFVTAYVPVNGTLLALNYPPAQAVDAASALLASSEISIDYDVTPAAGAQTDWVITFPTKHYYVDPQIPTNGNSSTAPFAERFGSNTPGRSDVDIALGIFDRSGQSSRPNCITPPPPQPPPPSLPYETQVVTFASSDEPPLAVSPALAAAHPLLVWLDDAYRAGTAHLDISSDGFGSRYAMRPSQEGVSLGGLPAIGFEAIEYVNANVTPGVLANYSAATPMHARAPSTSGHAVAKSTTCS